MVKKVLGSLFLGEVLSHAGQHRVCVQGSPSGGGDVRLKVCKAADGIDVGGKDLRGLPEGVGALAQLQGIAGQAQQGGGGMQPVPWGLTEGADALAQFQSTTSTAGLHLAWQCRSSKSSWPKEASSQSVFGVQHQALAAHVDAVQLDASQAAPQPPSR